MSYDEIQRRRDNLMAALADHEDPVGRLAVLHDVQDRMVAAVIAYRNGDRDGVNAVLKGVDLAELYEMLFSLLVVIGETACGPEGFHRALLMWRDATTSIDPSELRRPDGGE